MGRANQVLVVEDEAVVVASVQKILGSEGFAVEAAGSAEEAMQKLQTGGYGIILIDIVLPGVSGLQLTEILRKSHPRAITITFSGLATRENVIEALRCGAFDFIPKPFSFEELLGAVKRAAAVVERMDAAPAGAGRRGDGPFAGASPPPDGWEGYRFLGDHTWAKFEEDGSAVIGVDETFAAALAQAEALEFPGAFEEIKQGHVCVRITTRDKTVHLVWCALSGVVVESNAGIGGGRGDNSRTDSAFNGTWLVRVWPEQGEEEARNLRRYTQP